MLLTRDVFSRLCRARDLLCQVQEHAPSVREVAGQVEISPFHFIRQFEAVFGLTPNQFRISVRIERAKQLLALGELSITDVCLEVGFSSLGSFSDLFARRVGAPPSSYQRRVRPIIQVPGTLPPALAPGCLSLMALAPEYAFRNFGEASARCFGVKVRGPLTREATDANQAHQYHGRGPRQGSELLHRSARLPEEA